MKMPVLFIIQAHLSMTSPGTSTLLVPRHGLLLERKIN